MASGNEKQADCSIRQTPSILVVDDRSENIDLVEAVLSGLDLNLLKATSGEEALELFHKHSLALVILDVCMPGMDGLELARRIRATAGAPPILLVTALACNDGVVKRGYDIGVVDFVFKPFEPAVLRAKVQVFNEMFRLRQVERRRAQEAEAIYKELAERESQVHRLASELELRKAELDSQNRELVLSNSQLNSFAHVVSHDLRQPLSSILDYLELIEDFGGDASVLQWVKSSQTVGRSMQDLIDKVLAYSRAGQLPEVTTVDPGAALATALENLRASVKDSEAQITHGKLQGVIGSESLLACLFQNLIGNSIKYRATDPPRIHIDQTWCDDQKKWQFRVRDNGRGFKTGDENHIFEMFSRCQDGGEVAGCGIGLATCKNIVEAHGGRIWARPGSHGGAEFIFLLPGAAPELREFHVIGGMNGN